MKLSVTIIDKQTTHEHGSAKTTDRERVVITDASGPGFVIAGILRAIADDIDPAAIGFERQGPMS